MDRDAVLEAFQESGLTIFQGNVVGNTDQLVAGVEAILKTDPCEWMEFSDGSYVTGCGGSYVFVPGTCKDNNRRFCQYCGGNIVEAGQ